MSRYTVIGLGKFGRHVARRLYEKGHEVIGIDTDDEHVQDARPHCTQVVVGDATDPGVLGALTVGDSDAAVVSLGDRMDASILTTLYLRESAVKRIVAKAVSPDHGKILSLIAPTHVIHPEREAAERVANALAAPSIIEYLPLGVGFSLVELTAPPRFHGQSLGQLGLRQRRQVLVVAVKNGDRLELVPGGTYVIEPGDVLVVIGKDEDLDALTRHVV
jgi:trk system potassium uptake protein TrkA